MDQRRLRIGDILDDYCPRERRVTNHAVVAMIEEDVKQTRCTTCDAEHVYKGGKAPRRKKAESTGALYKEVLAGITDDAPAPTLMHDRAEAEPDETAVEPEVEAPVEIASTQPLENAPADVSPDLTETVSDAEPEDDDRQPVDEGPVHRPLIRAQLPRPGGVKVERQAPDFTIRQGGRGNGSYRGADTRGRAGRSGGGQNNNGHRFGRGPNRGGGNNQRFDRGPRNKRGR